MTKKKYSAVWIVVILMVLFAACTKPLMPPEIEATGNSSESGFEDNGFAGDEQLNDDSQFASDPEPENFAMEEDFQNEPSVLMEEDLGALDMAAGGNDLELKDYEGDTPGNGSSGSFGASGGSADSSGGLGDNGTATQPDSSDFAKVPQQVEQEDAEARLFSYRSTSELKDIHFEFDRYDLDDRSKNVLSENASFLKEHPKVRVEIQGHCDERGTNNYNLALGQRRANSTKRFLKTLGIPETRMHVISYGEEKPFCAESNENCWWRNRRAHFLVAR